MKKTLPFALIFMMTGMPIANATERIEKAWCALTGHYVLHFMADKTVKGLDGGKPIATTYSIEPGLTPTFNLRIGVVDFVAYLNKRGNRLQLFRKGESEPGFRMRPCR